MPLPHLRAAALACAVLAATLATVATAAPLSLDQAVELAVQRSESARAARAGATGSAEMARAAGQLPDPLLSVGLDNLPATGSNRFSVSAEDMTMKRVGLAQEWVSADKRVAREAVATAMHRRDALMEHVAAAEARTQTALAYVDAFYAGQAWSLVSLNQTYAREEVETAKGRLATASGNSAEVLALQGALGLAQDELSEVQQQQAVAIAGLQRWTGAAAPELGDPSLGVVPGRDAFVERHATVAARQRDVDVARQDLQASRLNRRPNWTYELSYGQRSGRPDLMSFGVSIPLPVAPAARQDRETAARRAAVEKAEAELVEAQRAAQGEYDALASDLGRLQQRIERYGPAVLAPLRQRTEAALAAYRSNQASLVMVFEARRADLDAQRRLLNLKRELARTQAQLVYRPITQGASQ
jgi:outer membrane protein TolC